MSARMSLGQMAKTWQTETCGISKTAKGRQHCCNPQKNKINYVKQTKKNKSQQLLDKCPNPL